MEPAETEFNLRAITMLPPAAIAAGEPLPPVSVRVATANANPSTDVEMLKKLCASASFTVRGVHAASCDVCDGADTFIGCLLVPAACSFEPVPGPPTT